MENRFNRYTEELKKLSPLLYECAEASYFYKSIDDQLSAIKEAGYNAKAISHDIKNKYVVFFHEPSNYLADRCIFIVKFDGNIYPGPNGFMGALRVGLSLVERHGAKTKNLGDNGFRDDEDIRAIFGYINGWTYENSCMSQYYLGTRVFETYQEAKFYFNDLIHYRVI